MSTSAPLSVRLRPSTAADVPAITAIYADNVLYVKVEFGDSNTKPANS